MTALGNRGIKSAGTTPVDLMEINMSRRDEISAEVVRSMFDYNPETGHLIHKRGRGNAPSGSRAGALKPSGYRVVSVKRHWFQSARVVWLHQYGCWPTHQVDHINHVRDDDRLENLRDVTPQQNLHNLSEKRTNNNSGVPGVHWNTRSKRWYAVIYLNDKAIFLGSYTDIESAIAARRAGKLKYHKT